MGVRRRRRRSWRRRRKSSFTHPSARLSVVL